MTAPPDTSILAGKTDVIDLDGAARRAYAAKDWDKAHRLWRDILTQEPNFEGAWISIANVHREQRQFGEAERVLVQAQERFPNNHQITMVRAWNAISLRDWLTAESLWQRLREEFPDDATSYIGLSHVFRATGRGFELKGLAEEAVGRFPDNREIALMSASACAFRRDWEEAAKQFAVLQQKYPENQTIPTSLADSLRHLSRFDEADLVLGKAQDKFPDAPDIAMARARMSMERQDWSEALRRWDAVLVRFPNLPDPYSGMARSLRGAGLQALYERLLEGAVLRFPDSETIAVEFGWVAIRRRDWPTATMQWENLVRKFPGSTRIIAEYGFVLLSAGQLETAEMVLSTAEQRFPFDVNIGINLARVHAAKLQWRAAVDRLTALQIRYPNNPLVREELGTAMYNIRLAEGADQISGSENGEPSSGTLMLSPARSETAEARLVCRFESLGEDCEFGLFQRAVGAEPLGLLRFANTTPRDLAAALSCRFDGVGQPENFELIKSVDGTEYIARDKRFGMFMHTHIIPANVQYEPTYETVLKKVQYQKRQLVDDLEESNKIFVYRDVSGQTESYLPQITKALALYGQPKLFIVKLAEPGKPNGFIEVRDVNVIVGYIDRKGRTNDGGFNIPIQSWLQLCRNACEIWPAD